MPSGRLHVPYRSRELDFGRHACIPVSSGAIARAFACCLGLCAGSVAAAPEGAGARAERGGGAALPALDPDRRTVSLVLENDYFADSDDGYTGGFAIGLSRERPARDARPDGARARTTWTLVQRVYTPDALDATTPAPHERAWASWLHLERAHEIDDGTTRRRLAAALGLVGPSAGGGALQRAAHRAVGGVDPRGWDSQIGDRAAVQLEGAFGRRLGSASLGGVGASATAHADLALGTVRRHTGAGLSLGVGPDTDRRAPSGSAPGWRAGLGAHVRYVDHDLLVEERGGAPGRLTPKRWVSDLTLSVAARLGSVELGYRHVVRSAEFAEQGQGDRYGALTLRVFR